MPPQFQSSFIPRGPMAAVTPVTSMPGSLPRRKPRDIFTFICGSFFTLSVLLALGAFGYKYFLNYRIARMGEELAAARAALEPETVSEILALDNRLVSAETLLANHRIVTPIFQFLSTSTPKSVRYTTFNFDMTPQGVQMKLVGEATSYASLASAAGVIYQANHIFTEPLFSDLKLDSKGNVSFSLNTMLSPDLISYRSFIEKEAGNEPI